MNDRLDYRRSLGLPSTPDHRTHEQRILASSEAMLLVLGDIKHELLLARLERWGNVNKPPVDPPKPVKRK